MFETLISEMKAKLAAMFREYDAARDLTDFWGDTSRLLRYLLHLPADDLRMTRFHAGWIIGESPAQYWHPHPPIDPLGFAHGIGYVDAVANLPADCWIGEEPNPNIPGALGVTWEGRVINPAIVRYQYCIRYLHESGLLPQIQTSSDRHLMLEIGAGYGGLAHHMSRICNGKLTCIIVDLPETLLLSIPYLAFHNPEKRFCIYGDDFDPARLAEFDFVFVPHFALSVIEPISQIAAAINITSMDEMTEQQVRGYVDFLAPRVQGAFYCDNAERHWNNKNLNSLYAILRERFELLPDPDAIAGRFAQSGYSGLKRMLCVPKR